jgi:hypothetical protein
MVFLYSVLGFSQTTFVVDNIKYEVTDSVLNTVSATRGYVSSGELIIPETVNHDSVEYKVTNIGEEAFRSFSGTATIATVTIGDNVTSIGSGAFRGLTNMTKVTIGSSVSSIGELVFAEDKKLTEMVVKCNTPPLLLGGKITSEGVNLTVPEGLEKVYIDAGWTGFYSINGIIKPGVGFVFTIDGFRYKVHTEYVVMLVGVEDDVNLPNELSLPSTAQYLFWSFSVEYIGEKAFKGKTLEHVVIPNTVREIKAYAFESTGLTNVSFSEGLKSIGNNAFRFNRLETISFPSSLVNIGSNAFNSTGLKNVSFSEGLKSIGNNAFKDNILETITLPRSLTSIGDHAFESNGLTNVSFSEGLITIGNSAFEYNELSTVTLPRSLTSIGGYAFTSNRLNAVIAKGTEPASIEASSFDINWGTYEIDLYVPEGTKPAYINAGWTRFKSINSVVIGLAIKVYLEGASLNPYEGEDMYMRDDLRKMGLLPTESPYVDGVTIKDTTVLTTSGSNAIVDWVFVELRDGNDNTTVLNGVSALLQRDGDIVAIDGVSNVEFEGIEPGSYNIAVYHRNHLGIMSGYPITLPNSRIDFTVDPTNAVGGENSFIKVREGVYALIGGDYDANDQIQNTDKSSVVPIIGVSGYNRGDLDMNGQVQNTDITNIMNKNVGRGVQFNK